MARRCLAGATRRGEEKRQTDKQEKIVADDEERKREVCGMDVRDGAETNKTATKEEEERALLCVRARMGERRTSKRSETGQQTTVSSEHKTHAGTHARDK